jgi:hypothetical protein
MEADDGAASRAALPTVAVAHVEQVHAAPTIAVV